MRVFLVIVLMAGTVAGCGIKDDPLPVEQSSE